MKAQCSNCRFYGQPDQIHTDGRCKRRGWMLPMGFGHLLFGTVEPNDWCGEWEEGKRLARVGTDYSPKEKE